MKNMNLKKKSLLLRRETVRNLDMADMAHVGGGSTSSSAGKEAEKAAKKIIKQITIIQ